MEIHHEKIEVGSELGKGMTSILSFSKKNNLNLNKSSLKS
jgi:hypothetical protein